MESACFPPNSDLMMMELMGSVGVRHTFKTHNPSNKLCFIQFVLNRFSLTDHFLFAVPLPVVEPS